MTDACGPAAVCVPLEDPSVFTDAKTPGPFDTFKGPNIDRALVRLQYCKSPVETATDVSGERGEVLLRPSRDDDLRQSAFDPFSRLAPIRELFGLERLEVGFEETARW